MNRKRRFGRRRSYFEGWYLKHQTKGCSIAFIPAFHTDRKGKRTASVQVITENGAWNFPFDEKECQVAKKGFCVKMGKNLFSEKGISVCLCNENISITGTLHYSPFTKLETDMMGSFRFVPFMQCRHGVLSMSHQIKGNLVINEKSCDFAGGTGYVEMDSGSSFPDSYTWTQCSDWSGKQDCSLMASAASIPFGLFQFKGCICAIWYHGKEYRLATYRGARVTKDTETELIIRQGRYRLSVRRLWEEENRSRKDDSRQEDCHGQKTEAQMTGDQQLRAPVQGSMSRMIKENISCTVHYCFMSGRRVIFDFTAEKASFESAGKDCAESSFQL